MSGVDTPLVLYVVSGLMILIGLLGTALPMLPGLPLAFLGMLLAAWTGDFREISVFTVVVLGVLTVMSLVIDLLASAWGAKRAGASKTAMVGAGLGALVGVMLFNLPGLIIGPFAGAMVAELAKGKPLKQAGKVGAATWIGMTVGLVLNIGLAFAMLGIFLFALWY